ncbi:VOC family protein [Spongiactinospora sp. TRM90649]|uniref:VOC family protein n=1 Tax=Spongiactinospora sp. TRM90649 TaxID=3031114 RepID=UPI0023F68331|nr:VOC family protein [Spongiactinospora sp. TRM90649]MDF5755416.1 VOC family protein [Spongiactinospora sp. TRM90649]
MADVVNADPVDADLVNKVAWFEVATDDPDAAQRFYGELFGWSFTADPAPGADGSEYRLIHYQGEQVPSGGLAGTAGATPGHAIFTVQVADVAATCAEVERLGGKVRAKVVGAEQGPDFAYLIDTSGVVFGIFTPR